MSRKLTIIGLIALSTTLLYAGFSVSKAQLVAEQTHHDLGVVAPNEEVVHEFRLRKSGWGSLQITKVVASCGCLTARLRNDNGNWWLSMRMQTEAVLGPKFAIARIETAGFTPQTLEFELSCQVESLIKIEPLPLDLGNVVGSEASGVRLAINLLAKNPDVTVKEVSLDHEASLPSCKLITGQKSGEYVVELTPDPPGGPVATNLVISFVGNHPALTVPIRGFVAGDLIATPFEVFDSWSHSTESFRTLAELQDTVQAARNSFRIKSRSGDLQRPAVELAITHKQDRAFLEIKLKPSAIWQRQRICRGVVQIESAAGQIVSIPVSIAITVTDRERVD